MREGDAGAVHALLDEETRAQVDEARVAELLEDHAEELDGEAARLTAAAPPEAEARVFLASGEVAVLRRERDAWVLVGGVLDAPAQATPLDAVRALRHAMARRNLEGLLPLLSRALRAEVEAELDALVEALGDELALEVTLEGDAAQVRTPSGRVIVLKREAGQWRVDDVR
ncbi:MAG: hypothetical protein AAF447_02000 [Myxococcota bacterium]